MAVPMWKFRSTPQITREQALSARPVRNPDLEVTRTEAGEASFKVPRRRVWWLDFLAKFGKFPEHRVVTLDEIGTSVWDLCDGEHAVRDLIETFAAKFQISRKESELRMVSYLRELARRGIIVLVVDEKTK